AQGCWVLLRRMMEGSGESWVRWRKSRNVGNGVLQALAPFSFVKQVSILYGRLVYAKLCAVGLQSYLLVSRRTHQGDTLTIRTSLFFLPLLE
nr:hypothetical protein [Tanacetum cinerariifolium]